MEVLISLGACLSSASVAGGYTGVRPAFSLIGFLSCCNTDQGLRLVREAG